MEQDTAAGTVLCHRCGTTLVLGRGSAWVVRIEAFADPTPPDLSAEHAGGNLAEEINELVDAASDLSERELMDQVYRRLVLHLCGPCYRRWIEQPV